MPSWARVLAKIAVAAAVTAVGVAGTWVLIPAFGGVRFFVPLGLLAVFALVAGTWPALVGTALTAASLHLLGLHGLSGVGNLRFYQQVIGFAIVALLLSAIGGAQRRSRARVAAQTQAALRQAEAAQRSDEQRRLALRAADLGTWDYNLCTGDVFWDERFKAIYGVASNGMPYPELINSRVHPDDRARLDEQVQQTLRPVQDVANGFISIQYRVVWPDGSVHWVHANGESFFDGAGPQRKAVRFLGTLADVTERRRAEEALRDANERLAVTEERYRLVNLATRDVVWDWDLLSGHVVWSDALESSFGYPLAQVPCESSWWYQQIHPDDRERVEATVRNAVVNAGARSCSAEYRFRHLDGRWIDVLDRGFVIRDERGRAVRIIGSMLDQTERKRAEEVLRRTEEQYRNLADAMPQMVWTTRPDGTAEYVNQHWCEYTGFSLSDTNDEMWWRILHPDDVARTQQRWHHSLITGDAYEIEYRLRSAQDGMYRWFLARALPVRDAAGHVTRWFGTCTDIDHRKRIEVELAEEKSRLDVILSSLPVGVYIADAGGRIVETNERARSIWAGSPAAETISDYAQFRGYWPDTGRRLSGEDWALARALLRGETVVGEMIDIERFDGTAGTILTNAAPFRNARGTVTGAVVVILDVTELKRAQTALREREARARDSYADLEQSYRYAPVGLFTFDRDCRFLRINETMAEINGLSVEAHIGKSIEEVVPDLAGFLREKYRPVFERGEPVLEVEIHGATPKAPGVPRDWIGNYYPLRSSSGEVIGLIAGVVEVTERRRAERALRESEERLRDVDRRKNEFLAMLSHELRNPLAPIRNSLYILDRVPPGGEQARRAHEVIGRQVTHMTRLIDDLLDVTRISRGKIHLQRERIELGDLVRRTAEDHRFGFASTGVQLDVSVDTGPVFVDGDPTRLSQVIGNLLGNAAKFTPRGGHVGLSLSSHAGVAEIRVSDDGAGISPELLKNLFQPFVQAEETLDRSKGGLGLGLALVKGLVELHGGTVAVTSDGVGRGAQFVVRLQADDIETRASAPAGGVDGERVTGGPLRVLVIEDNVDAAESLKEALELNHHQVELASTGDEGIQKARGLHPDVVLCDIGLPGMDGFEVARRLRADPDASAVRLVALSGYAATEDRDRSMAAGFVRHLAKPPDLDVLESTLAELTRVPE